MADGICRASSEPEGSCEQYSVCARVQTRLLGFVKDVARACTRYKIVFPWVAALVPYVFVSLQAAQLCLMLRATVQSKLCILCSCTLLFIES